MQAALNAALTDLPGDLPTLPTFRKANPAAAPILILALTSKTMPPSAIYDAADTRHRAAHLAGRRRGRGHGQRRRAAGRSACASIPCALAAMGVSLEDVRTAIANANALGPLGAFDGRRAGRDHRHQRPAAQPPRTTRRSWSRPATATSCGCRDVATVEQGVRNSRSAAWFNGQPSVLLIITKQADANVIETVDRINALLPELKRWIPAGHRHLGPVRPHQTHPRQRARHAAHAAG